MSLPLFTIVGIDATPSGSPRMACEPSAHRTPVFPKRRDLPPIPKTRGEFPVLGF
jgi:hypothetical protein